MRNPALRCARAQHDDSLIPDIQRVWHANMQAYGADKDWKQMNREGIAVARCTVERLIKRLGLRGVRRGKVIRTTIGDANAPCPLDRVSRQFKADWPNQLWVSGLHIGRLVQTQQVGLLSASQLQQDALIAVARVTPHQGRTPTPKPIAQLIEQARQCRFGVHAGVLFACVDLYIEHKAQVAYPEGVQDVAGAS